MLSPVSKLFQKNLLLSWFGARIAFDTILLKSLFYFLFLFVTLLKFIRGTSNYGVFSKRSFKSYLGKITFLLSAYIGFLVGDGGIKSLAFIGLTLSLMFWVFSLILTGNTFWIIVCLIFIFSFFFSCLLVLNATSIMESYLSDFFYILIKTPFLMSFWIT